MSVVQRFHCNLLRADADLSQEHEGKSIYLYRQQAGIIGISQCILTAGSLTSFLREGYYIRLLIVSLHTKSLFDLLDTILITIQLPVESLMQLHAITVSHCGHSST